MLVFNESNKIQRCIAYVIDMLIILCIANLIVVFIYYLINFSTEAVSETYESLVKCLMDYYSGSEPDINLMLSLTKEYLIALGIELLVSAPVYLILCFIYLVILPKKTKWQTLGRLISKVRVVNEDGSDASWGKLFIREIVGTGILYLIVGGPLAFVSALIVYFTNRSLIDKIAKTKLIASEGIFVPTEDQKSEYRYDRFEEKIVNPDVVVNDDTSNDDNNDEEYKVF